MLQVGNQTQRTILVLLPLLLVVQGESWGDITFHLQKKATFIHISSANGVKH